MPSKRSDALNTIIKLSIEQPTVKIEEVEKNTSKNPSRRTIRRALEDAEQFNWLKKRSTDADTWCRAKEAKKYATYEATHEIPKQATQPVMYYVKTPGKKQHFFNNENILTSAGAAWQKPGPKFSNSHTSKANHLLIDSGGYQAAVHFQDEYPFSPEQLHEWAQRQEADAVFGMDWACEKANILAQQSKTEEQNILNWKKRLKKSYTTQIKQYKQYKKNNYEFQFRPVIQGKDPKHFKKFAQKVKQSNMPTEYIAIGTVCKRSNINTIHNVIKKVKKILPNSKIHLFGATLNVYKNKQIRQKFTSSDTAAWMHHDNKTQGKYSTTNKSKKRAYKNYKQKVKQAKQN